jgi:hypothetical protein
LLKKDHTFGSRDIETSPSYVFLNGDRLNYLNDDDWLSLVKTASDTLSAMLSEASILSYTAGEVLNLLKIRRPLHFHEEEWTKLTKKIVGILFLLLKKDHTFPTKDGLLSAMKGKRPDQIPEGTWSDYQQFLKREYFNTLSEEIEMISLHKGSPIGYLEDQQLDCLPQEKADDLRKRAYRLQLSQLPDVSEIKGAEIFLKFEKPSWIEEFDYKFRLEKAKRTTDLEVLTQKYQSLLRAFESMLTQEPIGASKPETLSNEEWINLLRIDAELRAYTQDKENLAADKNRVSTLKSKIERQLDIIHNVLIDPSSVDRIEDYSNVFSTGNFENLRLLSKKLKAIL